MSSIDLFVTLRDKADREAQALVNELRNRIKSIESTMGDDFESKEFERGRNQIKFLERIVTVVITQQNMSVQLTEAIGKEYLWTLDKETELAKEKLLNIKLIQDLESARSGNQILARMMTKLGGAKIIRRPLYVLNPKFVTKLC